MSIEQRIMEAIAEQCGKDVTVEQIDVAKNNGVIHKGFRIKEVESTFAPIIYYDVNLSDDDVVDFIVSTYAESLENPPFDEDFFEKVFSKENVLSKVLPVLVNAYKNADMFESVVNTHYISDLAIIYKFDLGSGYITITNSHLKHLDISKSELHEAAINNIQGKCEMKSTSPFGIFTTKDWRYGASAIFDREAKKAFDGLDLFFIPSSVDEWLVIDAESMSDDADIAFLKSTIANVNANALEEEKFLSNNLFRYQNNVLREVED